MEKSKRNNRKVPAFGWWVLMALLMVCGVVAGGFFGVTAIIGCLIAAAVFAWQAWGEWLEIDTKE